MLRDRLMRLQTSPVDDRDLDLTLMQDRYELGNRRMLRKDEDLEEDQRQELSKILAQPLASGEHFKK